MQVGDVVYRGGCFTKLKCVAGQSLPELEKRLGFRTGRLAQGAYVLQASELPRLHQFHMMGYTQVAADRFQTNGQYDQQKFNQASGNADEAKLRQLAYSGWATSGPNCLIKIIPVIPHSAAETYPPGSGVPQWEITTALRCRVVACLEPYSHFNYKGFSHFGY